MLASAVLALLANATAAAGTEPAQAPSTPSAVKEKKICRVEEAITGSMTPKRTCKTKAEWDTLMGRNTGQPTANDPQPRQATNGGNND